MEAEPRVGHMIKADKTANGQTNRWTKQKAAEPTDKKTRRWTHQQTNSSQQKTAKSLRPWMCSRGQVEELLGQWSVPMR